MDQAKPFEISKRQVWQAYKQIKANKGAAGIDRESIEQFEQNLGKNLYKLWNRLSSGSYQPAAVRRVDIPKQDGKTRPLGIPTVTDRIAQMVVKNLLEPDLEPVFHEDSYGYRPQRSAHHALEQVRQRCRYYSWVLDLDIKGFFDNIDHELLMKAVRRHTHCRWILLYIERWLKAPVQMPDGTLVSNVGQGTPQGGVISPLLANLFLHYVFDKWMQREFGYIPFARYADDIICHCSSQRQADYVRRCVEQRMAQCKLQLHPEKTQIVYCRDQARKHNGYPICQFSFLGYEFRPRRLRNRHSGELFVRFTPAISPKACKALRQKVRSWRLHRDTTLSLQQIVERIRPALRGWVNYYGHFNRSVLINALRTVDEYLVRWAARKFKRLNRSPGKAYVWLKGVKARQPDLLPIWTGSRG